MVSEIEGLHRMNALTRNFLPSAPAPAPWPSLDDHAPYRDARLRHVALLERQRELQATYAETLKRCIGGAGYEPPPRQDRVAGLAGLVSPSLRQSDSDLLSEMRAEIEDVKQAIAIVADQERAAWLEASAIVCDGLAGEHREIMRALFGKLVEVHAIWTRHEAMLDRLIADNVAMGRLQPRRPDFMGVAPERRDGELARWMRELVSVGYVAADELPKAYR